MTLFKLLERRHAEPLTRKGRIRVTTLYECAKYETAGPGRSDPEEGIKYTDLSGAVISRGIPPDCADEAAWIREQEAQGFCPFPPILGAPEFDRDWYKSDDIVRMHTGFNVFLYCVSCRPTRRIERRLASGDDCWVEIFDSDAFFGELNAHMTELGHTYQGLHAVRYRVRRFGQGEDSAIDASRIKDPYFSCENESRALWTPKTREIGPLPFELPALTKYCRIFRPIMPKVQARDSITLHELSTQLIPVESQFWN